MTEGPVGPLLVRLTGPMILGIVSMVLFNLADTFFVSRLSGRHLAALSFTYPVVLIVNSLALGLGMGASAVISRAVGRRDHQAARRLTTDSLGLALLIVGLFVIAGLVTIGPVFRVLGASEETLVLIRSYMRVWYPGMVFVVVPMVGNNAIRARGDTLTPGLIMLASATINTVLDPLLIFGWGPFPRLEMAGAAWATVMARASSLILAFWVLICRERLLCLVRPTLAEVLTSWRQILYLGLPTATTRLVTPLGMGIVTRMAAAHGEPVVAALGVGSRLEFFGLTVVAALSTVLAPFVGQNLGAGQNDRVRQGVSWASRFALAWGAAVALVLGLFARPLATLFSHDAQVVTRIAAYLRWVPWAYGGWGVTQVAASALTVMGRPLSAAGLTLIQVLGLMTPLAWILSRLHGPTGLFLAVGLAYGLTGGIAHWRLRQKLPRRARE